MQKDGVMLILAFTGGEKYGAIRSLTGVADLLEWIQVYLDEWKTSGETVTVRIQEPLRSYIDFFQRQKHNPNTMPQVSLAEFASGLPREYVGKN